MTSVIVSPIPPPRSCNHTGHMLDVCCYVVHARVHTQRGHVGAAISHSPVLLMTATAGTCHEQESADDAVSDGPVSVGVPGDPSTPDERALRALGDMRQKAQANNQVRGAVYACLL